MSSQLLHELLAKHALAGLPEEPLTNAGYSGSRISRIQRPDGASFVLKRMSPSSDWIMRATADSGAREAAFARAAVGLPPCVTTPNLGAVVQAGETALLMHDITRLLVPDPAPDEAVHAVIRAMAALHDAPAPDAASVPWCGVHERLMLLTTETVRTHHASAALIANVTDGWNAFRRHASAAVVSLVGRLHADPQPLLRALLRNEQCLLHGDLKLDNVGVDADERVWLIDWAMTMVGPAALELGWFMAINSRRIAMTLDDVLAGYADAREMGTEERREFERLAVLCGLVLRGWRKGLDAAAGDSDELVWWSERAHDAVVLLR